MDLREAVLIARAAARVEEIEKMRPAEGVYVWRPVINGDQVSAWALRAGLIDVVAPSDLHVTVAYSPTWAYLPPDDAIVLIEGARMWLGGFGPDYDIPALEIEDRGLRLRQAAWLAAGATSSFHDYRPHVTLSYTGQPRSYDLPEAIPDIVLGPEQMEELVEDWSTKVGLAKAVRPGAGTFCGDCPAPSACVTGGCIGSRLGKSWASQPRVPSGPNGGQWTAGGGFGVGLTAPQYGIADGYATAADIPVPKGPLPDATSPMWNDNPEDVAVYVKGSLAGESLNGVAFTRWPGPRTTEGWASVDGQNPALDPGPVQAVKGKSVGAGVIIAEPDGRVWVVEPTNHYGGYEHTFPKGTAEKGLSLQANAIKEAWEESGLKVEITGYLGDYERTTSVGRYYIARRVAGSPVGYGPETQAVKLVPVDDLGSYLNMPIDKTILGDIQQHMDSGVLKRVAIEGILSGPIERTSVDDVAEMLARGTIHTTWAEIAKKGNKASKQPRAPAGTPIGGQWIAMATSFGGAGGMPQVEFDKLLTLNPNKKGPGYAGKFEALNAAIAAKDLDALKAIQPMSAGVGHLNFFQQQFNIHLKAGTNAVAATIGKERLKAATAPGTPTKVSDLTYEGPKPGGSAQGAIYKDASGQKWLVKGYPTADQARNEVLASRLYALTGASTPTMGLIELEGKHGASALGVASKWEDGVSAFSPGTPGHSSEASKDFAADAWLANWDVVGLSNDNLMMRADGTAVRIDPGGALLYRATGAPKGDAFGNTVGEWNTLRDPKTNPQAAPVFAAMGPLSLRASAKRVTDVSPADIRKTVESVYGKGSGIGDKLTDTLVARQADIAAKADALAPKPAPVGAVQSMKDGGSLVKPAPLAPAVQKPAETITPLAAYDLAAAQSKFSGKFTDFYVKSLATAHAAALAGDTKTLTDMAAKSTLKNGKVSPNLKVLQGEIATLQSAMGASPKAADAPAVKKPVTTTSADVIAVANTMSPDQLAPTLQAVIASPKASKEAKLAANSVLAGDFDGFASFAALASDSSGLGGQMGPVLVVAAAKGPAWQAGVKALMETKADGGASHLGAGAGKYDAATMAFAAHGGLDTPGPRAPKAPVDPKAALAGYDLDAAMAQYSGPNAKNYAMGTADTLAYAKKKDVEAVDDMVGAAVKDAKFSDDPDAKVYAATLQNIQAISQGKPPAAGSLATFDLAAAKAKSPNHEVALESAYTAAKTSDPALLETWIASTTKDVAYGAPGAEAALASMKQLQALMPAQAASDLSATPTLSVGKPSDATSFAGTPPPAVPAVKLPFYQNVQNKIDKIAGAVAAGDAAALAAIPKYGAGKPNSAQKAANDYHDAATAYLSGGGKATPEQAKAVTDAIAAKPKPKGPPPFDPSKLTPAPDFVNWKGPGQGLSTSTAVNAANTADTATIHAAAAKGDLAALKALTYQPIDKVTGQPVGAPKAFSEHPSQHVREYHAQMVQQVHDQLHPPEKLRIDTAGDVATAIASALPKLNVAQMAKHTEKLGRYAVLAKLSKTPTLADFGTAFAVIKDPKARQAYYDSSRKAFDALPHAQRAAIKAYTGGDHTDINHAVDTGTLTPQAKAAVDGLAQSAQPLHKGIVLSRRITQSASAAWLKKLRDPSSVGVVLAENGVISTSMNPAVWSGQTQLRIHTVGGSKGLYVAPGPNGGNAISTHPGEAEVILPTGSRFVVVGHTPAHKLTAAEKAEGWGGSSDMVIDVVMLPD